MGARADLAVSAGSQLDGAYTPLRHGQYLILPAKAYPALSPALYAPTRRSSMAMILLPLDSTAVTKRSTGMRPVLSSPYLPNMASTIAGLIRTPSLEKTSMNSARVHRPSTPPRSLDTDSKADWSKSRSVWLNEAYAASFFLSSSSLPATWIKMSEGPLPPGPDLTRARLPVETSAVLERLTSPHLLVDHIGGRSPGSSGSCVVGNESRLDTTGRYVQFFELRGLEVPMLPAAPADADICLVPDMLLALAGGGSGMVDPARRVDCPKAPPEDVLLRDCSISSPAGRLNNGLIDSPRLTQR